MSQRSAKRAYQEQTILNVLNKKGSVQTSEAVRLLGVSECTVRRLFSEMEEKGSVIRRYGGVVAPSRRYNEYRFDNLQFHQSEQKQRIGSCASKLVQNRDIIFLDSGTTVQRMAYHLVKRAENNEIRDVQVFTNSLENLKILSKHFDVNLIGGLYRSKREDFCGYLTELIMETVSFDKCFLGADGVSIDGSDGLMGMDILTIKLNRILIHRSGSCYLLADSTKFRHNSFIKYAEVTDMDMIITDKNLDDDAVRQLESLGVPVRRA